MENQRDMDITRRKMFIGASAGVAGIAAIGAGLAATATSARAQESPSVGAGDLAGKRVLVTGASRGIGATIALTLADRGADVAITYLRSTDRAAQVVQSIREKGRQGLSIQADSGDPAAVKRSVDETVQKLGGLDILVNNVGIGRMGPFVDLTLDDIDALLAVNVRSAVLASQAAIPHLGQGGRIITTGSNAAERGPFPGLAGYSMTKSALMGLTRHLARELGPQGITVNLVQPGPIDTELNPANGGALADMNRQLTSLGRYGTTQDIANVVAFLASPASSFMTGSIVTADGGYNA